MLRAVVVLVALVLGLVGGACDSQDPNQTVSATPSTIEAGGDKSGLHEARLDAARRLGTDPLNVELTSLRHAGWDGCYGVISSPNQACTALFVGGYIAMFRGGGREFRYHMVGSKAIGPVDPAKASDGSPVPPEIRADFAAALAAYARYDVALRTKLDVKAVAVLGIVPSGFPERCTGTATPPAAACAEPEGGFIKLSAGGKDVYVTASAASGIAQVTQLPGVAATPAGQDLLALEQRMREDLAKRLGVDIAELSVVGYRLVTWPDGCLGVIRPDAVCSQALVAGFLARLTDGKGTVYRYHGTRNTFVAASLEPGARLGEPLLGQ